jgi:myo-inositol catabolism protein IolH
MVKIALDPAMYHADMSVADEVRKTADLGYEYFELSPRSDWFFWHHYPKADDAAVAEVRRACKETGVVMQTLVPVFNWSSPDEQERQAQVRNWKRLLEICAELECPVIVSEFSGDPNQPRKSEHAFYRSMEELSPVFERYGIALNLDAHPYDFVERNDYAVQIIRGLNKPWVNYVFCAPHAFHLDDGAGDVRRMMRYAGDKLKHLHIADCYNHRANVGNRYIINPPGADVRIHQHNEIGNGDLDWDGFFTTARDMNFDGVATVCVFGWEETADDIHRRMLERVTSEFADAKDESS